MLVRPEDVRHALDNDQIVPCFQPLVELRTGRLTGFEVLARWQHAQLGLILPDNFIQVAEETGFIGELMGQILEKAFLCAPSLPESSTLAVNISPLQLHDPQLPGSIRAAATRAGFPLQRLKLEITENALVDDLSKARRTIKVLKALGCKLSLDDFGTGYSSLQHLHVLPFDELKIDRSFIATATRKRESRKIIAAIVGLAHSLGLGTVAEGIETEAQADMLLRLGCKEGQGWLYGQPTTSDKIPELVKRFAPRDVSEREEAPSPWVVSSLEALPAQRLAQLQAIYDGAPVGLCFLDCDLRYISINKRLSEMNGMPIASHLGRTVQEVIPGSFPLLEPYLLRALKGEAIADVAINRQSNKPGGADWICLLSYQPAFDEDDEVIGISVVVVDVTKHQRTEEALVESEEHYRHMVELNPQIPWIMGPDGNILDVSSQWIRLTGFTREASLGKGWLNALHPADLPTTVSAVERSLRSRKAIDIEYRVVRPEGGWRWMRSRGSPRLGPSGEVIQWYGSVEDIDEWKAMELALKTFRAQSNIDDTILITHKQP
jgi:PAS domain S-box-containing protein